MIPGSFNIPQFIGAHTHLNLFLEPLSRHDHSRYSLLTDGADESEAGVPREVLGRTMYLPLFDIVMDHQFFMNRMRDTLTVSPTGQTAALIDQLGLSSRQTPNGIRMLYEVQRLDTLQQVAISTQPILQLGFTLVTADHSFARYTEPICPDGSLFYFEQLSAHTESPDTYRLHRDPQVSTAESDSLESPRVNEVLQQADRDHSLLGVINIVLAPTASSVFDAQFNVTPRTYVIRFAARQAYWTYYLLGSFARDGLYMEDAKGEITFESLGEVSLPGDRTAWAFRSTTMLPLQDRYHNRFQIVDPNATGDRILMARMPGAEARQTHQERLNGIEVAISDIFINGF